MKLKRNILANYAGQLVIAGLNFAIIPVYIGYLGLESYGLFGVFALVQAGFTIVDMSVSSTINREVARYKAGIVRDEDILSLIRTVGLTIGIVSAIAAVVIWLLSGWIAAKWISGLTLEADVIRENIIIMGVLISIRLNETIYRSVLMGGQEHVKYNILEIITGLIRILGSVLVLEFCCSHTLSVFIWYCITSLFSVLVFRYFAIRILPRKIGSTKINYRLMVDRLGELTLSMTKHTVLVLVLMQLDKFVLSDVLNLEEFAVYSLCAVLAGGLYMVTYPIVHAVYPKLTEKVATNNFAAASDLFYLSSQMISIVLAVGVTIGILYSEEIIGLWTNNNTSAKDAWMVFSLLLIGNAIDCMTRMRTQLGVALNEMKGINVILAYMLLFYVPLLVFLSEYGGTVAVAGAWVLVMGVKYILYARFLQFSVFGDRRNAVLYDHLIPLAAISIAGVVVTTAILLAFGKVTLYHAPIYMIALMMAGVYSSPHIRVRAYRYINEFS